MNTSRDSMPMDETITGFGDRLITLTDHVIAGNGGEKITLDGKPFYRLKVQEPGNIEGLTDFKNEPMVLQKEFRDMIEHAIVRVTTDSLAWAGYMAICLDIAPEIMNKYPEQWGRAIEELLSQKSVMQAIFNESPLPAGNLLRRKAAEAGLVKP